MIQVISRRSSVRLEQLIGRSRISLEQRWQIGHSSCSWTNNSHHLQTTWSMVRVDRNSSSWTFGLPQVHHPWPTTYKTGEILEHFWALSHNAAHVKRYRQEYTHKQNENRGNCKTTLNKSHGFQNYLLLCSRTLYIHQIQKLLMACSTFLLGRFNLHGPDCSVCSCPLFH